MADLSLTYSIADIVSGLFDAAKMDEDIQGSSIERALVGSSRGTGPNAGVITITFVGSGALSTLDKTKLDGDSSAPSGGLIGAHTGEATSEAASLVKLDVPTEADGKPTFVMAPNTKGYMTWFTGAGDDSSAAAPASGRGTGTDISIDFTGPADKFIDLTFIESIEMHDGQLWYTPQGSWANSDRFTFSAYMSPTVTTVNLGGTGNCNLVPTGAGYNLIVPAAGDGGYDVDLSDITVAVPVPATGDTGYWDVLEPATGVVSPSTTPGGASWHLLDVAIESFFLINMPMGHPFGVFDIESYKAEWISPAWKLRLRVVKVSPGSGSVGGWLMLFREKST